MSCFVDYSKSPYNKFELSDKELHQYYWKAHKSIVGKIGYIYHTKKTYEDFYNPHFLRDACVKMAIEYYALENKL